MRTLHLNPHWLAEIAENREHPVHGPLTRTAAAVEAAIARGYGGPVTDAEMAGPTPATEETHTP
jgi:hypothetical protein